jgi:hypothetical protein
VNYDLCHSCYLAQAKLSHDEWQLVPPLGLHIEVLHNAKKKTYFTGEDLLIDLFISNLTLANLDRLTLQCVRGTPPFAFEEASYQLDMKFGQVRSIRIGGVVLARPGKYVAAFQFRSDQYQEPIAQLIEVGFVISANWRKFMRLVPH